MEVAAPESERNAARLLIFAGCLSWLAASFYFAVWYTTDSWSWGSSLAEAILGGAGAIFLLTGWIMLSRHDRVRLEGLQVVVESRSGRRTIPVGDHPAIEVCVDRRNTVRGPAFTWGLFLRGGDERAPILVRDEYYLEFRNLAEMLARGLGCRLIDRSNDGDPIEIPASDLDLPFRERVRRRPDLLGERVDAPPRPRVTVRETGEGRVFTWRGSLLGAAAMLLPAALLFSLLMYAPQWIDRGVLKLFDDQGLALAGMLAVALVLVGSLLPLAYEAKLVLGPDTLDFQQSVQGLSVTNQSIPWSEVEEIRVFQRGGTTRVEVFSDQEQINVGTSLDPVGEAEVASWLASEVREWAASH